MRITLTVFSLLILALTPYAAPASLIDFEDLTPADPSGFPTDASGEIRDGYHGFDWASGPAGSPGSGKPRWAALEGYLYMPGTGTAYAYGEGLSMSRPGRAFSVQGVDTGSYFYAGQGVLTAGWDHDTLKYCTAMTVGPAFELRRFNLSYSSIDRFAVWATGQGTLEAPFDAPHALCIDNISYEDDPPAPVPEASSLLILGAGILGCTSMYRKLRAVGERGMTQR